MRVLSLRSGALLGAEEYHVQARRKYLPNAMGVMGAMGVLFKRGSKVGL